MPTFDDFLVFCPKSPYRPELTVACQAALTAGAYIRQRYTLPHQVRMKGAIDLVTETDTASEEIITGQLKAAAPDLPIMAEETTTSHGVSNERIWVVDPLDGTTNFVHGFPHFAVSIALLDQGVPVVGVVYAPMLDELFWAIRGGGAWLGPQSLTVSSTTQLIAALIATGFPYAVEETLPIVIRQLRTVLPRVQDIRRAGAAALDLAYVACGRLDGFYEMHLQPWDTAAGWLLVEEAGGTLSNYTGAPYSAFVPELLATNGHLHQDLLALIR